MKEYHYIGFTLVSKYLNIYDLHHLLITTKKFNSLYDGIYELHIPISLSMIKNDSNILRISNLFTKVAFITLEPQDQFSQQYPYTFLKLINQLNYFNNISMLSLVNIHIGNSKSTHNIAGVDTSHYSIDTLSLSLINNTNKSFQMITIKNMKGINIFIQNIVEHKNYQLLKKLHIEYCNELMMNTMNNLLHLLPCLNHLHLESCINMKGGLELTTNTLQNISSLKIIKCMQINLNCLIINNNNFSKLIYCDLSYSNVNSIQLELLIKSSPIIKYIIAKHCLNISYSLNIKSRSLESIDLNNSINILSLTIICPLIKSINLHLCFIIVLVIQSTLLSILDLSMLTSLLDLFIDCPILTRFILTGCSSIRSIHNDITNHSLLTTTTEITSIFGYSNSYHTTTIQNKVQYPSLYDIYRYFPYLDFHYFINYCIDGTNWMDNKDNILKELNIISNIETITINNEIKNQHFSSNSSNTNNSNTNNHINKNNMKKNPRRRRSSV